MLHDFWKCTQAVILNLMQFLLQLVLKHITISNKTFKNKSLILRINEKVLFGFWNLVKKFADCTLCALDWTNANGFGRPMLSIFQVYGFCKIESHLYIVT